MLDGRLVKERQEMADPDFIYFDFKLRAAASLPRAGE
jgi:hypothetical protein